MPAKAGWSPRPSLDMPEFKDDLADLSQLYDQLGLERAALVGGVMHLDSRAGHGTHIRVEVPVSREGDGL